MPTRADYAKINIACKDLGIDKHHLVADRYAVDSTTKLTPLQTADLLRHLKSLGWKPRRKAGAGGRGAGVGGQGSGAGGQGSGAGGRGSGAGGQGSGAGGRGSGIKKSPAQSDPQRAKVVALWITLHQAGQVRSGDDRALQRYVKRMTGLDNLAWCSDVMVQRVCQGLVEWCKRCGVDHG
jgi:phage gp16-like protein